jgi:hypothetical protein
MTISSHGRKAIGYAKYGFISVLSLLLHGLLGYILAGIVVLPAAFAYGFISAFTGSSTFAVAAGVIGLFPPLALYGYVSDRLEWVPTS